MKEFKCKNCCSSDIEHKNGFIVCNSCGSRFIPDSQEIRATNREAELEKQLVSLFNGSLGKLDDDTGLQQCIKELHAINPKNNVACVIRFCKGVYISELREVTETWANLFFNDAERVVDTFTADSYYDILKLFELYFERYSIRFVAKYPKYKDKMEEIISKKDDIEIQMLRADRQNTLATVIDLKRDERRKDREERIEKQREFDRQQRIKEEERERERKEHERRMQEIKEHVEQREICKRKVPAVKKALSEVVLTAYFIAALVGGGAVLFCVSSGNEVICIGGLIFICVLLVAAYIVHSVCKDISIKLDKDPTQVDEIKKKYRL